MRLKFAIAAIVTLMLCAGAVSPSGTDRFASGLDLFNAGQWTQAAARLAAAAMSTPGDFVVRLTAGVALANVKRYSEAVEQFMAAARLSSSAPLPQFLLDGTYSEIGKAQLGREARSRGRQLLDSEMRSGGKTGSEQALLSSLSRYPRNAIGHCLLGDVYQLQGKSGPANARYVRASELAPKWAKPVFNLGMSQLNDNPAAAEASFSRAIKIDPSNSRVYLWKGDALLRQGRNDEAIDAYKTAARDKSLEAEALTRVGNAQMKAGDFASASSNFDVAAQRAPQDPRPIAGKAQALQKAGKYDEAEKNYQQAEGMLAQTQAAAPSRAVVKNQMATLNAQMGDTNQALGNYTAAFQLHPTPANAQALAKAHKEANRLDDAIATYEAALRKNPRDVRALNYLSAAYGVSQNCVGQLTIVDRLLKVDPANAPRYLADIGAIRARLGDVLAGVAAYSRSLDAGNALTWPDTAESAKRAGLLPALKDDRLNAFGVSSKLRDGRILFDLQRALDDKAGMLSTAMQLVKINPDDPTLWLRLGEASERAGDKATAELAYSKAAASFDPTAAAAARSRLEAIRGK